jgi:hypothetical protein
MCQEYLEAFERNLGELTAINVKLERKVELNNRYRDAVSPHFTDTATRITYTDSIPALCSIGAQRQSELDQTK